MDFEKFITVPLKRYWNKYSIKLLNGEFELSSADSSEDFELAEFYLFGKVAMMLGAGYSVNP